MILGFTILVSRRHISRFVMDVQNLLRRFLPTDLSHCVRQLNSSHLLASLVRIAESHDVLLRLLTILTRLGLLYGALQSYARACFAQLIPPGEEARFFALYSVTDKSSSFIGPAVVGIIADITGSIRYGFIFIMVALVLSLPILASVNMQRGRLDALASRTTSPESEPHNGRRTGEQG